MVFWKCVIHTKFTPFSTPVVLYNKHLPYPKTSQITIGGKRKQEKRGPHNLFYWRCSTVCKSTLRNKKERGKKGWEWALAQWVSFYLLRVSCFLGHCYRSQFWVFCVEWLLNNISKIWLFPRKKNWFLIAFAV